MLLLFHCLLLLPFFVGFLYLVLFGIDGVEKGLAALL